LLATLALTLASSSVIIAEESSSLSHTPVQYRRIFVPADKMGAWPRDGEKLIPIESREFESLVASANDGESKANGRITIDRAEYSAHLDSDGQLQGEGRWVISTDSQQPRILALDNFSLVIRNPRWAHSPPHPARIGMWCKSNQLP